MSTAYRSYRDLPPLAGLCSFEEAQKTGLSIDDNVARLKREHYALKRLHEIFIARLTGEPIFELKMAFGFHAHICAEHVQALATRVSEMREPPLGLDVVPHRGLEILFDEILGVPTTEALLLGLYGKAVPAVIAACERHLRDTNPLVDHPTVRLLRFALLELRDVQAFGEEALAQLVDTTTKDELNPWLDLLNRALAAAGGLDGAEPEGELPKRSFSQTPFVFDGHPRRDERFHDPYNLGVNAEAFLYDERFPEDAKTLMLFFKRLREVDVPELMASIITETKGRPWGYYRDMTRQLWDEARHALMGEVGFVNLGLDWTQAPVNFTWALELNTQLPPKARHAVLYFIEQGLMSKTGKRYEYEVGEASGNPLSRLFQDYDWADEVLHAQIGRAWYVTEFDMPKDALKYGDESWSAILDKWQQYKAEGKTVHRNWWPDFYRAACARWGREPDPKVLAYDTTYAKTRADLKTVTGSG